MEFAWRKIRDEEQKHDKKREHCVAIRIQIKDMLEEFAPGQAKHFKDLVSAASRLEHEDVPNWPHEEDSEQEHWLGVQKNN